MKTEVRNSTGTPDNGLPKRCTKRKQSDGLYPSHINSVNDERKVSHSKI